LGAQATDLDFEPFHEKLMTASGTSLREQVHWTDFCEDARRQGVDLAGCPGWQLPGEIFVWFKSLMLFRRPRRGWGSGEAPGSALEGNPSFEADRRRFDALASFYGNRYRGSVVINYLLGAVAVLLALVPAALRAEHGRLDVLLHGLEFLCIVLIVVIYWRGRSPGPHDAGQIAVDPTRAGHRRWHERWLEYRGLAERFRYAELLYPLEAEVVKGFGGRESPDGHEHRGWAQRYFEWRFGQAKWPRGAGTDDTPRYAARLRRIMHEQKTYHEGNAAECEAITRRLHMLSGLCFAGTLVACALAIWWKDAHWLLLLAAGLPALAASVHGILATVEYIKLGESSTAAAGAIGRLMADVEARLAAGSGRGEPDSALERLVPEVRAFWNLVTSEATGWQATLRDKNVPLP